MTNQLIIDDVLFPTSTHDRYSAYEEVLAEVLEMADRSAVEEVSGKIWRIAYEYDYMGVEKMRECLAVLRRGGVHQVAFLPDTGDEMISSQFLVDSLSYPSLAFIRGGVGRWHKLTLSLREVRPHA